MLLLMRFSTEDSSTRLRQEVRQLLYTHDGKHAQIEHWCCENGLVCFQQERRGLVPCRKNLSHDLSGA